MVRYGPVVQTDPLLMVGLRQLCDTPNKTATILKPRQDFFNTKVRFVKPRLPRTGSARTLV